MGMPIVQSMLDQDFYILTQANAVLQIYPDVEAEYLFVDRNKLVYDKDFLDKIRTAIVDMSLLNLRASEYQWLQEHAPYLSRGFLEFLKNYRFNPDQVNTLLDDEGHLIIRIKGPMLETIWWEIPLMATISEIYFARTYGKWNMDDQQVRAEKKASRLSENGCFWADFGTRRRRSYRTQSIVVETMKGYPGFVGTSNAYLAMKYGVKAIGTMAHQFIQLHSALDGLRHANRFAMDAWTKVYRGDLGVALTDTYGIKAFFDDFDLFHAKLFDGIRQDSGDCVYFAHQAVAHYKKLGIPTSSKTIVFSDNLNVDKAVLLQRQCEKLGIRCSFGIGTHFSNDFNDGQKLNIVIKLVKVNNTYVVKLSDDVGKAVYDNSPEGRQAYEIACSVFHTDE